MKARCVPAEISSSAAAVPCHSGHIELQAFLACIACRRNLGGITRAIQKKRSVASRHGPIEVEKRIDLFNKMPILLTVVNGGNNVCGDGLLCISRVRIAGQADEVVRDCLGWCAGSRGGGLTIDDL